MPVPVPVGEGVGVQEGVGERLSFTGKFTAASSSMYPVSAVSWPPSYCATEVKATMSAGAMASPSKP